MTTLTEFLLARIAEDEAAATLIQSAPAKWTMTVYPHDGEPIPVAARAFDPARVLAQCKAHRRIVNRIAPVASDLWPSTQLARHLLVDLALPYADHPDYHDEWRP